MITFEQIGGNVVRLSLDTDRERRALHKLLERKIKDPDSGLKVPITVVWGKGLVPAGLVPYMVDKLQNKFKLHVKTYEEDDEYFPIDDTCFVNRDPRDYQLRAARTLLSVSRGIMEGVTGAGKTTVIGAMIHAIMRERPDWRIGVIGFTTDHWAQVRNALHSMEIPTQQVGRGTPSKPVAIGRFSAFEKNIAKAGPWNEWLRTCEVLIYDEVRHLGSASTYINFARQINPLRTYGFDGTPLRNFEDDNCYKYWEDMQTIGYCGPIRVKIRYRDLQRLGYLPLTYVNFVTMPKLPKGLCGGVPRNIQITTNYNMIYKHLIVENDYRTSRFARLITNLAGGGKIIALIKQHEHARRLMEMLLQEGVESMAWFGAKKALAVSPSRGVYDAPFTTDEVRRRFMETDLPVVVGSSVLSEAISLDVATDAVNLAAGRTFSLSGQRTGRIMRRDGGRTPMVTFWDAWDMSHRILESQSRSRKGHLESLGLHVQQTRIPEVVLDLRRQGYKTARVIPCPVDESPSFTDTLRALDRLRE